MSAVNSKISQALFPLLTAALLATACSDDSTAPSTGGDATQSPTGPALAEASGAVPADSALPQAGAAAAAVAQGRGEVVPDQYIVILKAGSRPAEVARANRVQPDFVYDFALNGFAAHIPEAALQGIRHNPHVEKVVPVLRMQLDPIESASTGPADAADTPSGGAMSHTVLTESTSPGRWGLDRTDQSSLPLSGSYSYRYTGAGVTVYIIDSGIRWDHQEFGGRVSSLYDAIDNDRSAWDCYSHGTHVAGTVGGRTVGIAKQVSLVAVRIFDCKGEGRTDQAVAGINEVIRHKYYYGGNRTAVANMSFGWYCTTEDFCLPLYNAVKSMTAYGIVPVAAAGNGKDTNGDRVPDEPRAACDMTPARVPGTITVSGTYHPNSSYGRDQRVNYQNYGTCVDWFAPGHNVYSAVHTSTTAYEKKEGTSMATPHVAGAAALLLEAYPTTSPSGVRDALFQRTTKGVVYNAYSANNHMLYVKPCGFAC
jgi:aqualysin 1